ncbi:MAG: hypothetical protein OEY06_11580 [Gammaproteobacteria bacterium]|nr:hypothetical protein [Gammaproteobacteria bacterium]
MKKTIITIITWALLILLTSEITRLSFNQIYFPFIDPENTSYDEGPIPYLMLLSIYIISFSLAGYIMSWQMKDFEKSISISMSIGVVWLALEATFYVPVFFLMPNHPLMHDYIFTFIGALTPPLFCSFGSYLYCKRIFKKDSAS